MSRASILQAHRQIVASSSVPDFRKTKYHLDSKRINFGSIEATPNKHLSTAGFASVGDTICQDQNDCNDSLSHSFVAMKLKTGFPFNVDSIEASKLNQIKGLPNQVLKKIPKIDIVNIQPANILTKRPSQDSNNVYSETYEPDIISRKMTDLSVRKYSHVFGDVSPRCISNPRSKREATDNSLRIDDIEYIKQRHIKNNHSYGVGNLVLSNDLSVKRSANSTKLETEFSLHTKQV